MRTEGEQIVTTMERLYKRRMETPSGCWEWIGARTTAGYGELVVDGKVNYTHRLSWELHNGPIPAELFVLHRCDNPPCFRPDHLFLGTHQINIADKMTKGRHRHGHLYGDDHPARKHPETFLKYGEDHHNARITWAIVREIRASYATSETKASIAKRLGLNRGTVYKIVNQQQWKE